MAKLTLYVGDYAYSSWSLRGWMLVDAFGLEARLHYAHLRSDAFDAMRKDMAPARLVPALGVDETGTGGTRWMVWDSLAMAETLAELFPKAGHWPVQSPRRAAARALCAEMHSGFTALRSTCPMNMHRAYAGFEPPDAVLSDLTRIGTLWSYARALSDGQGPWLLGRFCVADVFFAPVASRIATYDLPVDDEAARYVRTVLAHPSLQRWYAMAQADPHRSQRHDMDYPARPNPHDVGS